MSLEIVRSLHGDIEVYRSEIVKQMMIEPTHPRHRTMIDHFIVKKLKQIADTADKLQEYYEDDRDELLDAFKPKHTNVDAAIREFEGSAARLREYHRLHPQPPWRPQFEELSPDDELVTFADAEKFGRCLDLTPHYHNYYNFMIESATYQVSSATSATPDAEGPLSFIEYVRQLSTKTSAGRKLVYELIPTGRKVYKLDTYHHAIQAAFDYFVDFQYRIKPLDDATTRAALEDEEKKVISRWGELSRNWIQGRLSAAQLNQTKEVACLEHKLARLAVILGETLSKTITHYEAKQTRTPEELQKELEADTSAFREAFQAATSKRPGGVREVKSAADYSLTDYSEEEKLRFVTDCDRPLDADGNPIPKWLYNLHQLDKKFSCEICGGEVYRGPKVFDEHFKEQRHAEGLMKLGIPPDFVSQLNLVTSPIEAVKQFQERRKDRSRKRLRDGDEEIEDASGTVMTKARLEEYRKNFARR